MDPGEDRVFTQLPDRYESNPSRQSSPRPRDDILVVPVRAVFVEHQGQL